MSEFGTSVLSETDGIKSIENVTTGEMVLGWCQESRKLEFAKAAQSICEAIDASEVIQFRTYSGNIVVSRLSQNFIVWSGEEGAIIPAELLTIGTPMFAAARNGDITEDVITEISPVSDILHLNCEIPLANSHPVIFAGGLGLITF